MRQLDIIYRDPNSLKPDPGNARFHPKAQIDQLTASFKEFGFVNPILLDESGRVIAGHGRLLAAKRAGLDSVPTITIGGLSDAQKRALRVADNKIALNATWDPDLLRIEIELLAAPEAEFDLQLLGFSSGELDGILNQQINDADDQHIPAVPSSPFTKLGDIWSLGEHRLGCGDARDSAFLERVVGVGQKVDAAFLDPPYNVRIQGHANIKSDHPEFAMASGEMNNSEFRSFLQASLQACVDVSRDGAVHFNCMDWRHTNVLQSVADDVYGAQLNLCVWNKSNAGMGSLYRSKHELVFVYRVGGAPHFNAVELGKHGRNRTNVWDYPSVNTFGGSRRHDLALHPTVKPIAMVADAIQDVTRRGELVLDAFVGSGATLLAAERTGRRFRGIDIDRGYVDLVVERWKALTGGKPRLSRARGVV